MRRRTSGRTPHGRGPMRHQLSVTLLALAASAACTQPPADKAETAATAPAAAPAVDVAAARAAIAAANKAWDEAYLKGDAATIVGTFADDGARHPPGKPTVSGRAAIEAGVRSELDSVKYTASVDSTDELIVAGDYVIEIGSWKTKATNKSGKAQNQEGRYTAIWKRDATGAWKIYRDIGNLVPSKP